MNATLMRILSRWHARAYRMSGGLLGSRTAEGLPVLLLTTRGRRSGKERTTPLVYLRDGDRRVVCGGSGGTTKHPAWLLNLRSDDRVLVQIGRTRTPHRAREAEGPERESLWRAMAKWAPRVLAYQASLERRIPLVVLEPLE